MQCSSRQKIGEYDFVDKNMLAPLGERTKERMASASSHGARKAGTAQAPALVAGSRRIVAIAAPGSGWRRLA
jgi:hypothetical protein